MSIRFNLKQVLLSRQTEMEINDFFGYDFPDQLSSKFYFFSNIFSMALFLLLVILVILHIHYLFLLLNFFSFFNLFKFNQKIRIPHMNILFCE